MDGNLTLSTLIVGVLVTAVLIVVGVSYLTSGGLAEQQAIVEKAAEETQTIEETIATEEQNSATNTLIANSVVMGITSVLTLFNTVMLFLFYKFLKHSQKQKCFEHKDDFSVDTSETFTEYLSSEVYRLHDYLYSDNV